MKKVFVDTDVTFDLLSERHPHYQYAAALFFMAKKGQVQLFVSALSIANIYYFLEKQLPAAKAREAISKLKSLVTIIPVGGSTVELALASGFKDFEDALQYHAAEEQDLDVIITRNIKDYKSARLPVMTAEEFVKQVV